MLVFIKTFQEQSKETIQRRQKQNKWKKKTKNEREEGH
jgi:hypothetical protein